MSKDKPAQDLLRKVMEADPSELSKLILEDDDQSPAFFYARILLAYWRSQIEDLKSLAIQVSKNSHNLDSDWQAIHYLSQFRIAIRNLQILEKLPERPVLDSELWDAEIAFVEAMYFETQNNDSLAEKLYLQAQKLFHKSSAYKKASKAFHNAIAARSRIFPSRKYINEYQEAAEYARRAGDFATEAAALNNLSREFQLIKAPFVALRYVNSALELLRRSAYGSYTFYMALCHRCQINLELDHRDAARIDFEEASAADFPEIKNSVVVLRQWMADKKIEIHSDKVTNQETKHTPPTWIERQEQGPLNLVGKKALSELEAELIQILSKGPQDRHSLIAKLWDQSIDFFHLENRLKQLLFRIRKKHPNLIGYGMNQYYLKTDTADTDFPKTAEL